MFLWTGCLLRWLKASGISKAVEPPCAERLTGVLISGILEFSKGPPGNNNEGWNSPRLQRNQCHLRVQPHLQDALHSQGRHACGNLLLVPSVLHGPAEADGHRWTYRSLRK